MNNRFSCALRGVPMESIDPVVRVTDVTELPPRMWVTTAPTARHGLKLLRRVRESLTVRVSFLMHEYDPARRRELLSRVHAWADRGGWLTTSDRPGQRLSVVCDTLPTLSALCWSDELQLEFTAYAVPFWETEAESETVTDSTATLTLDGNADGCPVSAEITNAGANTLTTLTLQCGNTQMTFDGLALAPGGAFTLTAENGLLRAEVQGESVLMRRTADSSDLLLADGGVETAVRVSADQAVHARFHARGRWL